MNGNIINPIFNSLIIFTYNIPNIPITFITKVRLMTEKIHFFIEIFDAVNLYYFHFINESFNEAIIL